jgi:hypothetical protein
MARSYNSVGAGETPKLGSYSDAVGDVGRPGSSKGQTTAGVKIVTDIPSVARPGAQQGGKYNSAGDVPAAARPGSAQGVHKSGTVNSSKYPSPD